MFWSFWLAPYQQTPVCPIPNIILQKPPTEEPEKPQQNVKLQENQTKHVGI